MRCPDCNKFVSLEMQDPEVECLDATTDAPADAQSERTFTITGSVRVVRCCAECGQEMKEANLDIEQEVELGENVHLKNPLEFYATLVWDKVDISVEEAGIDQVEEGGGRYAKSYFGASVVLEVHVLGEVVASVTWSDKVAASAMDELV